MACPRANRAFEFHKSRQLFIRTHNKAAIVASMCVSNATAHFSRFSSSRSIRGSGINQRSATST